MIPSDNELLGKFIRNQDEQSLLEIVRRHSPMVMGVCQSLLWHNEDAEDAFQATFLVLANKANRLLKHSSVAGWLHQVAVRNCRNLKRQKNRKREVELSQEPAVNTNEPWKSISDLHDRELVQQELSKLPKQYREVIILCHIEGQSRAQAAETLDCTTASVKAMLARGRKLLRLRLIRHGIVASTVLGVLAAATQSAKANVSQELLVATTQICQGLKPQTSFGSSPESIQLLAHKELVGMNFIAYSKIAVYTIIGVSLITFPLALLAQNNANQAQKVGLSSGTQTSSTGTQVQIQGTQQEDDGIWRSTITSNQLESTTDLPPETPDLAGMSEDPLMDASKDSVEYWELVRSASEARIESYRIQMVKFDEGRIEGNAHEFHANVLEERAKILQINLLLNKLNNEPKNSQQSDTTPNGSLNAKFIPPASTAKIQPGEVFTIESYRDASLNRRVVVAADSTITLPLIGVQKVKDLSQEQLREKLNIAFKQFITEPMIDVYRELPPRVAQDIPLASDIPVQAGETLAIESFAAPSFNRIVIVQEDLTITAPLVGVIHADDLTPTQLSEKLNISAKQFVKNPEIQVYRGGASDPLKKLKE